MWQLKYLFKDMAYLYEPSPHWSYTILVKIPEKIGLTYDFI